MLKTRFHDALDFDRLLGNAGLIDGDARPADHVGHDARSQLGVMSQRSELVDGLVEPFVVDIAERISGIAQDLLREWLRLQPGAEVRLLGVGVGDLQAPRQADLFDTGAQESRLDATIDGIRGRFGTAVLTRASLLPRPKPTRGSRQP